MLIFPYRRKRIRFRRNNAWGRGKDVGKAQKQQAIQGLSACEGGVVLHSPGPALRDTSKLHLNPGHQVYLHRRTAAPCLSVSRTFKPGLESKENARTWSTGLPTLALTPRRSAARYHRRMAIREIKIQVSVVSIGFYRTSAACGWLVSGHAQWPPGGWRRPSVAYWKGKKPGTMSAQGDCEFLVQRARELVPQDLWAAKAWLITARSLYPADFNIQVSQTRRVRTRGRERLAEPSGPGRFARPLSPSPRCSYPAPQDS